MIELYQAIKFAPDWTGQAVHEVPFCRRMPTVYDPDIDRNWNGTFEADEIQRFVAWVDENIPTDYTGPWCIDQEHPWLNNWSNAGPRSGSNPASMKFCGQLLKIAKALRPHAWAGMWGLPTMRMWTPDWALEAAIEPLLRWGRCLHVNGYDYDLRPDVVHAMLPRQIHDCLSTGLPTYVWIGLRQYGQPDRSIRLSESEVRTAARVAVHAGRIEPKMIRRTRGVVVWDACSPPYLEGFSSLSALDEWQADMIAAVSDEITKAAA